MLRWVDAIIADSSVEILVGLGMPLERVRLVVRDSRDRPVSASTLRRYFKREIEQGTIKVHAQMGNFIVATAPRHGTAAGRDANNPMHAWQKP